MSRPDLKTWALIACAGCAAGGSTGVSDTDSMVTTDPVASADASREAGMTPREAGLTPREGGMTPREGGIMPPQRDAAQDRDARVMTPDSMVDSTMPPISEDPNYGTFVLPQLTSAGAGRSAGYKLSLRVGAPQPYGHGAAANYRVSLGTALGR